MPSSQEGVSFDELGICTACSSSEQKMHISWNERGDELKKILNEVKTNASSYDCILPISGGKDSFFQAHVLTKVYGIRPLAVTFSHNWYSETGIYNLQLCLKEFGLDHIQFTPSRDKVNQLARQSLFEIGDACWHCHAGVGSFPLKVAIAFDIKLLIWGESICEDSGRATYKSNSNSYDKDYFTRVSAKKTAEQISSTGKLGLNELSVFRVPSAKQVEESGIWGIHLGDYIFWDEERQTEFIKDQYGWRETEMEGAYKGFKSAECIMAGVHDYMCYEKRNFGRATSQACVDVRTGLMTRNEGLSLAKSKDSEIPYALDYYLKITGLSYEEFLQGIKEKRVFDSDKSDIVRTVKTKPNAETLIPFYEQLIDHHKHQIDKRLSQEEHQLLVSEEWWE